MFPRPITAAVLAAAVLVLSSCATAPSAATASAGSRHAADAEFEAVQRIAQELHRYPHKPQPTPEAELAATQEQARELHDRGLAFIQMYPSDPRRWDVLVQLGTGPYFTLGRGRGGEPTFPIDKQAAAPWAKEYHDRLLQLIAAPDSGRNARKAAYQTLIRDTCNELKHLPPSAARPRTAQVRQWLADFEAQDLGPGALGPLYHTVATMLEYVAPEECAPLLQEAIARHSSDSPYDELIRKFATGRLRFLRGKQKPVDELWAELGRSDPEVADPMHYRGKVVLVTIFPAGWENQEADLNAWYTKYHRAGFEVIQVTGPNRSPSAPPEQTNRAAMEAYVAKKHWPWKFIWLPENPTESIARTWGENSIPAWLIVGRDGRFIADGAVPRPLDDFFADLFAGEVTTK